MMAVDFGQFKKPTAIAAMKLIDKTLAARKGSLKPVRDGRANWAWIRDHERLRAEGAIFGLAADATSEPLASKKACIMEYFAARAGDARHEIEEAELRLQPLREEVALIEARLAPLRTRLGEMQPASKGLFRVALGSAFALGMCVFNGALIHELFRPHFAYPMWVTAGVMALGLFTLSQPVSILFRQTPHSGAEGPETWKQWLIELIPPFAATLFTVAWCHEALDWFSGPATFLLLLTFFVLAGKLLLGSTAVLPELALPRLERRRLDGEVARTERQLAKRRAELLAARQERCRMASPEQWMERGRAAVDLFVSEADLAREVLGREPISKEPILEAIQ
jgi:hypothetical protein